MGLILDQEKRLHNLTVHVALLWDDREEKKCAQTPVDCVPWHALLLLKAEHHILPPWQIHHDSVEIKNPSLQINNKYEYTNEVTSTV